MPAPATSHAVLGTAVAAGAALGALARWALSTLGGGAATTLAINILGCALLGALTVSAATRLSPARRALFGPGVLGGFTTYSAFALDVVLFADTHPARALALLVGTPAACVLAVLAGKAAARAVVEAPR